MPTDLILTAIARDRPGIVRGLAEVIARHGGNWIDSSMVRFSGEFAGIVRASVPSDRVAEVERALAGLVDHGIAVTIRRDVGGVAARPEGRRARLELTGADHPGIVAEVSGALVRHGVSIEKLTTQVFPGSMSGAPMCSAAADVVLPDGLDSEMLRAELERIAHDIMVDIQFTPAD